MGFFESLSRFGEQIREQNANNMQRQFNKIAHDHSRSESERARAIELRDKYSGILNDIKETRIEREWQAREEQDY